MPRRASFMVAAPADGLSPRYELEILRSTGSWGSYLPTRGFLAHLSDDQTDASRQSAIRRRGGRFESRKGHVTSSSGSTRSAWETTYCMPLDEMRLWKLCRM